VADEDLEEHAIGYQVLARGVPVEASDGTRVGTFERAIHHQREHMLDCLVMRNDDGRLFVAAHAIERTKNRPVILKIDVADVAGLPRYRSFLGRRMGS
jgi:hypothetical protein